MSALEINKYVGAIILALLTLVVIDIIGSYLVAPRDTGPVVAAVPEGGPPEAAAPKAPEGPEPIAPLLASADVAEGAKVARKCAACHTFDEGGANKIGPNLWNVVNRDVASKGGFSYSSALAGKDGNWSYAALNTFLWKPKTNVPGTKMAFAGVKKTSERADLIAFLRTLSASPAPLP